MHGPTCIFWGNLTPFSLQCEVALSRRDHHFLSWSEWNAFSAEVVPFTPTRVRDVVLRPGFASSFLAAHGDQLQIASPTVGQRSQNGGAPELSSTALSSATAAPVLVPVVAAPAPESESQVRKTQSLPRNWANFSLL
jgi:hypothetical protein